MEFLLQGGARCEEVLRPILELTVVIPSLLLAYFPVKSYLKQPAGRLAAWLIPAMLGLCVAGGALCRYLMLPRRSGAGG